MDAFRFAWPQDRRLFRRSRSLARSVPLVLAVVVAVALAVGWSGFA